MIEKLKWMSEYKNEMNLNGVFKKLIIRIRKLQRKQETRLLSTVMVLTSKDFQ